MVSEVERTRNGTLWLMVTCSTMIHMFLYLVFSFCSSKRTAAIPSTIQLIEVHKKFTFEFSGPNMLNVSGIFFMLKSTALAISEALAILINSA